MVVPAATGGTTALAARMLSQPLGAVPGPSSGNGSPQQFAAAVKEEQARWAAVVKAANIQAE